MSVVGVSVCGLSVGLFSFSDQGLDPFQVFAHGLWNLTSIDYGTYYVILNAIMLVVVFLVDKKKIGIGTVINLFLTGYMAEFSEWCIRKAIPDPSFAVKILFLIIGIVVMCLGSAIYFTADLGVSTYDAVAIIIDERKPKWKFRYIRIATDLVCVIIGGLLGAQIGIGTVITAFFMGPLISFFRRTVAEPMRYGREKRAAGD